jgi:hypothetical protein
MMDQPSLEAVVERLERVERENRRWRVASLLAILALAVLLWPGRVSAQSRVVDVEALILRDQQGVVRAELAIAPEFGNAYFNLNDRKGNPLIGLGGVDGTAIISMLDAAGKERLYLRVGPDALGNDRGPVIWLFDADNNRVWGAP